MLSINVLGGLYLADERGPVGGGAAQPRRLAVLAMLAVAGERGRSRDAFADCLWPDLDKERGRHALTQSLYALRRDLALDDLFLGQATIRLNPELIRSDHAAFRAALRAGQPDQAVEWYRGPFLQGFHLPGADTFERWVETERAALDLEYGRALEASARQAAERHDPSAALEYLRKRATQDPLNPKVAVKLMQALAAHGDIAGAVQHARAHEQLVRRELEMAPDPEVTTLAADLRRGGPAAGRPVEPTREVAAAAVSGRSAEMPDALTAAPQTPHRSSGLLGAALLIILATGAALLLARPKPAVPAERSWAVVAIAPIADYSGGRAAGQPLADMLATNLARASGFRVISNARMLELIRQHGGTGDSGAIVTAAARQAGAGELIDGSVYALTPTRFRLDVRRVDLRTGSVLRAYKVEGADLFQLADSGTALLVTDLGGDAPSGSLAEVTTRSVQAYRFYEEGLREFYNGNSNTAERQFRLALAADSAFAQAAFYYARANTSGSRSETIARLRRAVALARGAGDRERLVIEAEWAASNSSPALAAIAETLTVRYPDEVDGYYYAALGATLNGEYLKAVAPYRRVLALDSLGLGAPVSGRCRACEAYAGLGNLYFAMDSVVQAEAILREWARRQPASAGVYRVLAQMYVAKRLVDSALMALRIADSLEPGNPVNRRYLISMRSSNREYAEAERLIRSEIAAAPVSYRLLGEWDLAVVLRQMGRLREALDLATDFRFAIKEQLPRGAAPYNALLSAQVLFEMGRLRSAAALFDSIAFGEMGLDPSGRSRDRIWAWVHEADALAALRDTVRLKRLADSMEVLGLRVAQARERSLHHHVRGLIDRLRGRDAEAAQHFAAAITSPVIGFTRSNYELGGAYLRLGRPRDAIPVLRAATRGGTVGGNLYVTRTDLEERLAQAFEAAQQPDSALFYYEAVLGAWERPDIQFRGRRDSVLAAIARLGRH